MESTEEQFDLFPSTFELPQVFKNNSGGFFVGLFNEQTNNAMHKLRDRLKGKNKEKLVRVDGDPVIQLSEIMDTQEEAEAALDSYMLA